MKPEMETFVLELSGKSVDRRAFSEKQARKQKALVETLGGISEEQKEEIRSSLDFVVVDGQGKEYKLTDSEAATKKGRGIRPQDQSKIQKAMEKIINTVDQLRAAKDDAGKPLFDGKDLMDEVFTPMVREGLLPETLVIGKFSEVQKLLDAVFPRYRETLEEARVEKAKAKAKTEADYHGAGSTLDMLSAAGTKAGDFKDRFIAKFNPIGTTEEEKQRSFALASATYTAVSSGYDAVSATKDMISGKAIQDATDLLNNVQEEAEASTFFAAFADKAKKVFGLDERKAGIVANYIADGITQAAEKLDQTRDSMDEFLKKKWVQITKASLGVLKEAVESGKETGLTALEVAELAKAMGDAEESVDRQEGVAAVVGKIDGILASVVGDVNPAARVGGSRVSGNGCHRRTAGGRERRDRHSRRCLSQGPPPVFFRPGRHDI
jgi:ribosomal protein L22